MSSQEINMSASLSNVFTSFTEKCPENKYPVRDENNKKLEASDLFSLFTADIIREDVTFTR